jgi:EpsI family protein
MVGILTATAVLLHAKYRAEQIAPREKLAAFPASVGPWIGKDVKITADILEVLGPGDFASRLYFRDDQPPVDLFIAYFASQRTGDTIHSPKNGLPGSGWTPIQSGYTEITVPNRNPVEANRYVIGKGADRQLVLYWYQAHDRVVASEYWAKFYLVTDAIRMNRTDGSLVRISTPILASESSRHAENRATDFARAIFPTLEPFIPK